MKIEKNTHSNLTSNQSFFLASWYNLGHEDSLDSERVPVLNPMVGLKELLDLYSYGTRFGGDQKRLDVGIELRGILERGEILKLPHYQYLPRQLIELFSQKQNNPGCQDKSTCSINKNRVLISSLSRQLLTLLEKHYIEDTFQALSEAIDTPAPEDWPDQKKLFRKIRHLSEDLASALIWRGAGLWELYSFYRNILIKNLIDSQGFVENFATFREKALQSEKLHSVKFTLRSEGLVTAINNEGGAITFDSFKLTVRDHRDTIADIALTAMSASTAGIQAFEVLGKVVDVLGYTLGREHIVVQRKYISKNLESGHEKTFELRKPIPNPAYELPQEKFSRLISSLGTATEAEGHRDNKILAAFRLYRIGASSENLEAKFVTYWSALESITRDAAQPGTHDDEKVANILAPCIVIDYVNKRLTSFLKALHHTTLAKYDLETEDLININTLTNRGFFELLSNKIEASKLIDKLGQYPYLKYQLHRFSETCQDQERLKNILSKHQNKVKLQVKRIYRARNLITHTGGHVASLEFLCANLEHYLKTCVNSIIDLIFAIPTVKTSEEALVRYSSLLEATENELKSGNSNLGMLKYLIEIHQ